MGYVKFLNAEEVITQTQVSSGGNQGGNRPHVLYNYYLQGFVEVAASGYQKDVELFFSCGGPEWKVERAHYVKPLTNGRELWAFNFIADKFLDTGNGGHHSYNDYQIAVKLTCNGEISWDNNYGYNYSLKNNEHLDATETDVVQDNKKVFMPDQLSLALGFSREKIHIRYTYNDWDSSQDAPLKINIISPHNYRYAHYNLPKKVIEFALYYADEEGNITRWDNNYNKNYRTYVD